MTDPVHLLCPCSRSTYVTSALVVSAATGLQVMTPGWLRRVLGSACESGLGGVALRCVEFLDTQKRTNPMGLTVAHGIVTKACADVLAQTIPQQHAAAVWIDALRAFRSMLASVLSTSIPFYWWTRFMARSMPVAPNWVTSVLGKKFGTVTFKTVVTQTFFRPVNVFLFLFLQSVFRGGKCSAPAVVRLLGAVVKAQAHGHALMRRGCMRCAGRHGRRLST